MQKKELNTFLDFNDYWHFARHLDEFQIKIIFSNLPNSQKKEIEKSYKDGKWEDIFLKDKINIQIDQIKKLYGYNIYEILYKVRNNKSVYIPKNIWDEIIYELSETDEKYIANMLSGIECVPSRSDPSVVILLKTGQQE